MTQPPRIAIDGPSGSGKSTLGRELAQRLSLPYVDTGAMYRAVAWKADRVGASVPGGVAALLRYTRLRVEPDPAEFRIWVDGIDVTDQLRAPRVGRLAAAVAAIQEVRDWLLPKQRELAKDGAVVEGRDIGTVVLPDADCKFFLDAPESERTARRAAQLGDRGDDAAADVRERDRLDRGRRVSPLRPAGDAIHIQTGDQTVEESLRRMLQSLEEVGIECKHREG
ncbi:MAG: (d)CMP kinase [Acidobacteriota bacterium]